ncbi:hypothetical protein Tco_0353521 [Tanacetum coccineum]
MDDILASKFMEIFRNLYFELSFADALIHMPQSFVRCSRKMFNNIDKLIELTKTPLFLNENVKFDSYLALADLGASINLMPLSIWKKLQLSGLGTENTEKDEKQSQNDKTRLGMEKTVKDKAKSKPESQSSQKVNRKVNWSKTKSTQVNPEAKVKEI